MQLQYVGPKPIVDQYGVSFDKNEPDRYIYLYATMELIYFVRECQEESCDGVVDLTNYQRKTISDGELNGYVKDFCSDKTETLLERNDRKLRELIQEYKSNVKRNDSLSPDEKQAYLGNIDIMTDYYRQFVKNELVYECLLEKLADEIHHHKIKEIVFHLGNNYGYVFSYLTQVLSEHIPPLDADMQIVAKEGQTLGHFRIRHPQKSFT